MHLYHQKWEISGNIVDPYTLTYIIGLMNIPKKGMFKKQPLYLIIKQISHQSFSWPPAHHTLSLKMLTLGTFSPLEDTSLKAYGSLWIKPFVVLLGLFIVGTPVLR